MQKNRSNADHVRTNIHNNGAKIASSTNEEHETFSQKSTPPYTLFIRYVSKDKRISILKVSNMLARLHINHTSIEAYSRNTWQLIFDNRTNANRCFTNSIIRENGYNVYIPGHVKFCSGVIRDIDLDMNLDELREAIEAENPGVSVFNIFRLKKRNKTDRTWEDSESICIKFNGHSLPDRIKIWHCILKVSHYIPPIRICYKCGRLGHLGKYCNAKEKCLRCAGSHNRDLNCKKEVCCINCKGEHRTLDRTCPVIQKNIEIQKTMAFRNLPFLAARRLVENLYKGPQHGTDDHARGQAYRNATNTKSYASATISNQNTQTHNKNLSKSVKLVNRNFTVGNDAPSDLQEFIQPLILYLKSLISDKERELFRNRLLHLINVNQQIGKPNIEH